MLRRKRLGRCHGDTEIITCFKTKGHHLDASLHTQFVLKNGGGNARCISAPDVLCSCIHSFAYGNAAARTFGRARRRRPYGFVWVDCAMHFRPECVVWWGRGLFLQQYWLYCLSLVKLKCGVGIISSVARRALHICKWLRSILRAWGWNGFRAGRRPPSLCARRISRLLFGSR